MRAVTISPYRRYADKDKRTAEGKPQLEHRHFAIIAAVIKKYSPGTKHTTAITLRRSVAIHFANEFQTTNKKFDRERFLYACGVGDDS